MVADTRQAGETTVFFAERGRLAVDRVKRTVDLVLVNGTSYRTARPGGQPGPTDIHTFPEQVLGLNPEQVFPKISIQKGVNEKTIAELRVDGEEKIRAGHSKHPEVMAIQQKFSFPVACLVFGVIGVALGMTVARDSKLAGFVVGTGGHLRLLHRDVPLRVADQGALHQHVPVPMGAEHPARGIRGGRAHVARPLRRGPASLQDSSRDHQDAAALAARSYAGHRREAGRLRLRRRRCRRP